MRSFDKTGRFIDHVFREYPEAVINLPCGAGKSTHAVRHIALNVGPENRFFMVVRDRDTVVKTAEALAKFGVTAGVYLGFDDDECRELSGKDYGFKDCLRGNPDSKCRTCSQKSQCMYGNSVSGLKRDTVITTHQSFILLCEKGHDFSKSTVIIDENPAVFTVEIFTADELYILRDMFAGSAFPAIRNLLNHLLPFLKIHSIGMPREIHLTELPEIKLVDLADRVTRRMLKTLFAFGNSDGCPEYYQELFFRFLLFIRTTAQCRASIATAVFKDKLVLKKLRVDFRKFCSYRRFYVLDASADLSQVELPLAMPVLRCSEVERNREGFVRMHVVISNCTKNKRVINTERGLELYRKSIKVKRRKVKMLLSHNPVKKHFEQEILDHVTEVLEESSDVTARSCGLLRGTNEFRECDTAFFAGTGWFTSIELCGLSIALQEQRDIPWSRFMVIDENGRRSPRMAANGSFSDKDLQRLFMAGCIDKIYQAIYRTAVRDGKTVDIFLPIPSVDWLISLQRLMPGEVVSAKGTNPRRKKTFLGISKLINLPAGAKIAKSEAAELCGYPSWKQAKVALGGIYRALFHSATRTLKRRGRRV